MATIEHMKKALGDIGIDSEKLNRLELVRKYNEKQKDGTFAKYYACDRKTVYMAAVPATQAAYNLEQIRPRQYEPYECPFCGLYHIGRVKDRSMYTSSSNNVERRSYNINTLFGLNK